MYKVLKKNGSLEDFSWKKLADGLIKSGATQEESDKTASAVEFWLTQAADDDGIIESNALHIKVLETLKTINPAVAKSFEEFRKPEPAV